ncbi:DUF2285 domain-containing protein [Hyphomicrobium sp. 2TAF46]
MADPATILLLPSPFLPANPTITEASHRDALFRSVWETGDTIFSLLVVSEPASGVPLAAVVLLDDDTPDRLEAVTRFWTGLQHRPAPQDDRITPQRRRRLRQMLRVVDARDEDETYRMIAEVMFPQHHIEAASWVGNPVRETTIRLARDGAKLVRGGYRMLLRHPRRS